MTVKNSKGQECKRVWFPAPETLVVGPNANYLQSLCAGVVSPILHLPNMLWDFLVLPVVLGVGRMAAVLGLSLLAGITGRANGFVPVKAEETKS